MAKELPYFKFNVSEWNDGDVTLCSFQAQGLFINLCSLYWSQEGNLSLNKSKKRFKGCGKKAWEELMNDGLIKVDGDKISINFLDQQFEDRRQLSKQNAKNVKKRWNEGKDDTSVSDSYNVRTTSVYNKEKRKEEKKREEEKREEKNPLRVLGELPFASEKFLNAWLEWEQHRKEKRISLTPVSTKKQLKFLGGRSEFEAIGIIEQSIKNGWTGLFELKDQNGISKKNEHPAQTAARNFAERHGLKSV